MRHSASGTLGRIGRQPAIAGDTAKITIRFAMCFLDRHPDREKEASIDPSPPPLKKHPGELTPKILPNQLSGTQVAGLDGREILACRIPLLSLVRLRWRKLR